MRLLPELCVDRGTVVSEEVGGWAAAFEGLSERSAGVARVGGMTRCSKSLVPSSVSTSGELEGSEGLGCELDVLR
jgi:hypothetical protein